MAQGARDAGQIVRDMWEQGEDVRGNRERERIGRGAETGGRIADAGIWGAGVVTRCRGD